MSSRSHLALIGACAGLLACMSAIIRADAPVVSAFAGTPPWDAQINVGYHDGDVPGHAVNNSGVAVASAIKGIEGTAMFSTAGLCWGSAGFHELAGLSDGSLLTSDGPAPFAINGTGYAVGYAPLYVSEADLGGRAVRWDPLGVVTQLGNLEASGDVPSDSLAAAINSSGASVGYSEWHGTGTVERRAVRWEAGATQATALNSMGGSNASAWAINDAGTAVGASSFSFETPIGEIYQTYPVRWNTGQTAGVRLQSLGQSSDGAENAVAFGINTAGVIIGRSVAYYGGNESYGTRAVRWLAGAAVPIELGSLGSDFGHTTTAANAINDAGIIVGSAERWFGFGSPFADYYGVAATRWTTAGLVTELGSLGQANDGSISASALAINNLGVAAGHCEKYVAGEGVGPRAVIWNLDGSALDLNTLGLVTPDDPQGVWTLTQASSLSDTGFVAGSGMYDPDDEGPRAAYLRHFVMLVPQAGTYGRGDATLDRAINFDDLLLLAQHYGQPNPLRAIQVADLNLDGLTGFDDLLKLAQNYGSSASFESDWALARAFVPEPTSALVMLLVFGSRRKRR